MNCINALTIVCGRASEREYSELYPNRRQPGQKLFMHLYDRLGERGTFSLKLTEQP